MKIIQKQTGRLASMLGHRLNVINKIMTTNPHTEEMKPPLQKAIENKFQITDHITNSEKMNTECCRECCSDPNGDDYSSKKHCIDITCPCHQKSMNTEAELRKMQQDYWRKGFQDGIESMTRSCDEIIGDAKKIINKMETMKTWIHPEYKNLPPQ